MSQVRRLLHPVTLTWWSWRRSAVTIVTWQWQPMESLCWPASLFLVQRKVCFFSPIIYIWLVKTQRISLAFTLILRMFKRKITLFLIWIFCQRSSSWNKKQWWGWSLSSCSAVKMTVKLHRRHLKWVSIKGLQVLEYVTYVPNSFFSSCAGLRPHFSSLTKPGP